jgi:signal transduction histidine kinase
VSRSTSDRQAPLDYTRFGGADGLNSTQCSIGAPNLAMTPDGKLWVATVQGLAMIDMPRLPRTNRRPTIFVDELAVGSDKQSAGNELVLAPGTHHVELRFDSIELVSPEKLRFQYRMDDVDSDWLNADATRTAVYTSIPLGAHSFYIRACNGDGVWDRAGIAYKVTQRPYYYETGWFRLLAFAVVASFITGIYLLRLARIKGQIQSRFDERLAERTRIARELHDTLLQNFHGLLLRFQGAYNHLPSRPEEAQRALGVALDRGAEAITAARDTLQELRSTLPAANELSSAIAALSEELRVAQTEGPSPAVEVEVEGAGRELHPILRDEIYRITAEALRNAFRHAQAARIDVAIRYGDQEFRIAVKDNGKGIDPEVLKKGRRSGHWGLPGMRERAEAIGAELNVWSSDGNGTEVSLRVPAAIAYTFSPTCLLKWFNRTSKQANERDSNPRGG